MRIACLDLPAFPLQLVWRLEPSWRAHPVVVIDSDRPQGEVLWACERARGAGVLVGQRYAHALSLCGELRARVVPGEQITAAITELRAALHRLSPRVEPGEPGTFWLDGEGLERIFPEAEPGDPAGHAWSQAISQAIHELGYRGAIVVGFSRFASYAIARAMQLGVAVQGSDTEERATASRVALARLDIDPKLRESLARLGVRTVGELVRLPAGGILERFGRDAHRLYQLAAGERWDPLVPVAPPETPSEQALLDDDESDLERLMFAIRPPVVRLLDRLAARSRALTALHLELSLKHAVGQISLRAECIVPAEATLDSHIVMRLVHLRLTGMPLAAPVNAIRVWADEAAATRDQLALFTHKPRRDLAAANAVLASLRAELGDGAVVRAVLREAHLPEARYGWEPLTQLMPAAPTRRSIVRLIRRVNARPRQLPVGGRLAREDGWLLAGLEQGAVVRISGPHIVSGGWWQREVHREYHLAELRRGDWLWVYFDRIRRHWYCHGRVE
jgi:protein ImuB